MLLTTSERFSTSQRTIKNNVLFLVDDPQGLVWQGNQSGLGFYCRDTRFLSCFEILINETKPVLLFSSTETGYLSNIVYTNCRFETQTPDGELYIAEEETIQVTRESLLYKSWIEKYSLVNYNQKPVSVKLKFYMDADFADIFVVRHLMGESRGELLPPEKTSELLRFAYKDLEGETLETWVKFNNFTPFYVTDENRTGFIYETILYPLQKNEFSFEIQPHFPESMHVPDIISSRFEDALEQVIQHHHLDDEQVTHFSSDNVELNDMLYRSYEDLRMLMTWSFDADSPKQYFSAGIPWYVALFGRDSIIAARDCLILNPDIARSTLELLALYQGKEVNPWRDEEPGKILHELRLGELARTGQVPHSPYYGSVDSTPLWLILLYDYYIWTKDKTTLAQLWPNALLALGWIDSNLLIYPYLTYSCQSKKGLYHQGWKDSSNSAMYEDGTLAEPPLALCEVQGYLYQAKKHMAELALIMKDIKLCEQLLNECTQLKNAFNTDFWMEDKGFYAMGLDQDRKPLRVISSNPGHCLETDLVIDEYANRVAHRLMREDMYGGWGIRTLATTTMGYNPMSYHNGSVWPHDNAMIARGFRSMHLPQYTQDVFSGLFEACRRMHYKRMPELFCGFPREISKSDPPIRYPVACSPQAWAASAPFSLIKSLLNIKPQSDSRCLVIDQPILPPGINHVGIKNLRVENTRFDLEFSRINNSMSVQIVDQRGDLEVTIRNLNTPY